MCCFILFRLKHKNSKSRKYGLITTQDDHLEMKPLDEDDEEDEDMTVFDRTPGRNSHQHNNANRPKRIKK